MNIEHYREFIELANRLNYRKTAEALCMSQSALSKHIQSMERTYHAPLFVRDRNQVALTNEGAVLFEHAQQIVKTYDASLRAVEQSKRNHPLILSGTIESPDEHGATSEAILYAQRHGAPRSIHVRNAGSISPEQQFRAIREHRIDCFVSYGLGEQAPNDIEIAQLCNVPLEVLVSADNALSSHSSITLEELSGAAFIHLSGPNFSPIWSLINDMLDRKGVPHLVRVLPTDSVYDYMNLDLGSSVLVIPEVSSLVSHPVPSSRMKPISVDDPDFALELDAAYLKGTKDQSISLLVDGLRDYYRRHVGTSCTPR